eukprot:CAMPEP_0185031244 /NCGR_PEP_ID=MMETSP1103-20130426/18610_1 /TAXON_ID=36769 /ORGANISM="Paraphysomonas bandaiensis, Strain Caron Lab Isolate" /LENGTH=1024 /DNA_ID=CAMNT_0027566705 /DNA_START=286 /DNA_END=3360 /DNA_ORIENTATION=-
MRYAPSIHSSFQRIRSVLVDSGGWFDRHGMQLYHLVHVILSERTLQLYMSDNIDENDTSRGLITSCRPPRPPEGCLGDVLLDICYSTLDIDEDKRSIREAVFAREILSIPMLTSILSAVSMERVMACSSTVDIITRVFNDSSRLALPPSPSVVFKSGQWLLGNLASITPFLSLTPRMQSTSEKVSTTKSSDNLLSDPQLCGFIHLVCALLVRYDVPGVWQGRCSAIWAREGTVLTASAVPRALQQQLACLLDGPTLSQLYHRVIRPFPLPMDRPISTSCQSPKSSSYPVASDDVEVREALSSSGLIMARQTLQEHRDNSSLWSSSSKWASKLVSSMSEAFSSLTGGSSKAPSTTQAGVAARDAQSDATNVGSLKDEDPSPFPPAEEVVIAVCRLWSLILPHTATHAPPESACWKGMSTLCFSTRAIGRLWAFALQICRRSSSKDNTRLILASVGDEFALERDLYPGMAGCTSVILCIVALLKISCITLDDAELYNQGRPLPLCHLLPLVRTLNMLLFECIEGSDVQLLYELSAVSSGGRSTGGGASSSDPLQAKALSDKAFGTAFQVSSLRCIVSVLSDLHTRWARRPFSFAKLWEISRANRSAFLSELRQQTPLARAILKYQPWAIDFHQRMKILREILDMERRSIQGSDDINSGQRSRGTIVRVRRQRLLADGMDALDRIGNAIKDRIIVRYVNDFGEDEAGIDVGGLFKDFWTDLSARVFDPSFGLFAMTSDQLLYPNPNAIALYDESELDSTYEFLGRILGKALFENITVQPQFAHFFLAFMMGRYNFTGLVNDLSSLDADLFKNLMFLKTYEGDIRDLGLTFSVTDDAYGSHKEVELFPGGSKIEVTSQNRHRYINLTAKYYLHDRICRQARAFFSGLYRIVSPELLGMFCAPELQVLISGATAEISVADLKAHTRYTAGYHSMDRHIQRLWAVIESMSEADRALLVKFVTSCERPPSLGFGDLNPPFTIQRVDGGDDTRLPTASTCFNILKLPTYSSQQVLRDKLLTAIRSNSGFELS